RDFVEVCRHMFGGNLMIRADDAALKEGPHTFDGVGMHVGAHVLADGVIYALVGASPQRQFLVRWRVIRIDFGTRVGHVLDESGQIFLLGGRDDLESDVTASCNRADHDRLIDLPPAPNTAPLAADERFVYFDDAPEWLRRGILHRS